MTAEITVWVFGFITILCLLISGILIGYLLREWKKLDYILEDFQNGELKKIQNYELREARESRIVSRLLYNPESDKVPGKSGHGADFGSFPSTKNAVR